MWDSQFINALIITTVAGLSTSIGGAIGFIVKQKNRKFFSFTIGFTAGIMVGISFFELLPSGVAELGFLRACIALNFRAYSTGESHDSRKSAPKETRKSASFRRTDGNPSSPKTASLADLRDS